MHGSWSQGWGSGEGCCHGSLRMVHMHPRLSACAATQHGIILTRMVLPACVVPVPHLSMFPGGG